MNAHTLGIAFAFPGGDLRRQLALLVHPSPQALALHNANLCLCHVQPTPMFGGVMKLNFVQEASSLLRRKRFIQARAIMSIQIILDQTNLSGLRIIDIIANNPMDQKLWTALPLSIILWSRTRCITPFFLLQE